jgi:hypothetical protein
MALIGLVVGCSDGRAGPVVSPSPLTYQQLATRPLHLPAVAQDQFCPTSPITLLGGTAPRLGTPVEFGFGIRSDGSPWPAAGHAFNKTVWEFSGPPWLRHVLIRGARVDGVGELHFGGNGISNPGVTEITVTDPAGGHVPFYPELRLPVDSNAAFYLYPTTAGCYAMQADSDNFSEVVVFKAI